MKSRYLIYLLTMTTLLFSNISLRLATAADDSVEVLMIRPEKLSGYDFRHATTQTIRDPFNWSADVLSQLATAPNDDEDEGNEIISGLTLQSIFWAPNNPQAIINDTLVNVGDQLNDLTVEQISKDHVVMNKDGYSRTLEFTTKLYDFFNKDGVKN